MTGMAEPELELRQVHYFVAVAEEANFTRAAARLAMTQPALSRAVKALERTVGSALLVRSPQGVTLTPAGRTLLEEGKALLAQATRATAQVRREAAATSVVTVSGPGCDVLLLDRLVRAFNEARAPYRAQVSVGTIDDQLTRLRCGQADIALWRGPVTAPDLAARLLRHERGHVLVGSAHRLAERRSVTLAELADEPVIRWLGASASLSDPALWPDGPPGRPGVEVSDGLQMLAVVRLGQAVAFTADPDNGAGRPEGTVSIPLADGPRLPLHLVWVRERATTDVHRFIAHATPAGRPDLPPPSSVARSVATVPGPASRADAVSR
ncbi:LysR family transcriptional regulator [Streptomyces sp. NPDC052693]|uniref:LysR family transcriptional regulator n=1 Tax=Streptomyces sp. NPDC052693 TaxID=3155814 RepID=UPI0034296CE6